MKKTMKTKGDDSMEMLVVDAGSEKSGKRRKAKRVTRRSPEDTTKKPNGVVDEVMKPKDDEAENLVLDTRSIEETGGGKRRKTKLMTWRSPPHMEDMLITELIDYMVHLLRTYLR